MFFLWPQYVWLMLALPLLPVLYVWLIRRRGKPAGRYSSLGVVRAAAVPRHWRRHVPPALLMLSCSVLLFAAVGYLKRRGDVTTPWSSVLLLTASVALLNVVYGLILRRGAPGWLRAIRPEPSGTASVPPK